MFTVKEVFEIPASVKRPVLTLRIPSNISNKNEVNGSAIKIKKCLFGKCNPEDTLRLLEEQQEIDRRRILERFGIDVESIELSENENKIPKPTRTISGPTLRISNGSRKRKLSSIQPSKKITDFYKVKKACAQEKENKP